MMWQEIEQRLKYYQPQRHQLPATLKEAAVLIPILKKQQPELILTLRSNHLSTHRGEVSFPGGKRDPSDLTLIQTALRESQEEIALPPSHVDVVGTLQTLVSKHYLKVTPYVGFVEGSFTCQPSFDEIATIFTVPLIFFKEYPPAVTHRIDYLNKDWYVPCYQYEEFKIWGLTAMMIVELVNLVFDCKISLHDRPAKAEFINII